MVKPPLHLLFDSAKTDFYSAAAARHPTAEARFGKAFCRDAFIKRAKAKGEAGPGYVTGTRAGGGNLSRQNPPRYGPAENPRAGTTKLLLAV